MVPFHNPVVLHFAESTVTVYGYLSRLLGSAHDVVSCEVPKVLEVNFFVS